MRLVSATFLALIGGCTVGYQARVVAPPPPVVAVNADVGVAPAPAPVAVVDVEPAPAPVEYVQPDLIAVSPGVEVVYDYDQPVFFVNGFYWHQEGGIWYSSHYHTGGWVRTSSPPREVVSIRNPGGYSHYHPAGFQPHRAPEPVRVGGARPAPGRVEPGRVEPGREPGREPRPVEAGHGPVEAHPMEPREPAGRPVEAGGRGPVEAHPMEPAGRPVEAAGRGPVAAHPASPAPVHPVTAPAHPAAPTKAPPTKHK